MFICNAKNLSAVLKCIVPINKLARLSINEKSQGQWSLISGSDGNDMMVYGTIYTHFFEAYDHVIQDTLGIDVKQLSDFLPLYGDTNIRLDIIQEKENKLLITSNVDTGSKLTYRLQTMPPEIIFAPKESTIQEINKILSNPNSVTFRLDVPSIKKQLRSINKKIRDDSITILYNGANVGAGLRVATREGNVLIDITFPNSFNNKTAISVIQTKYLYDNIISPIPITGKQPETNITFTDINGINVSPSYGGEVITTIDCKPIKIDINFMNNAAVFSEFIAPLEIELPVAYNAGFESLLPSTPEEDIKQVKEKVKEEQDKKIKESAYNKVKKLLEKPISLENIKDKLSDNEERFLDEILSEINPNHLVLTDVYTTMNLPSKDVVLSTAIEVCPEGEHCDRFDVQNAVSSKGYDPLGVSAVIKEMIAEGILQAKDPFYFSINKEHIPQKSQPTTIPIPIPINPNAIDYDLAVQAYRGTSFTPEKRAKEEQDDYARHIENLYNELSPLAKTDKQKEVLVSELERYADEYAKRRNDILSYMTRVYSSMISGPARYPEERMRKMNEELDKKEKEFSDWQQRAINRIKKEIESIGIEESGGEIAVLEDEIRYLESMIDQAKMINKIVRDKNLLPEEKVARMVEYGVSEDKARSALKSGGIPDYELTSLRNKLKTRQNRIETLKSKEEKSGTEVIKEFIGGKIIKNYDIDRIQIIFDSIPPNTVRDDLKSNGWHWSPSNSAWQRQITPAAEQNAINIIGKYYTFRVGEDEEEEEKEVTAEKEEPVEEEVEKVVTAEKEEPVEEEVEKVVEQPPATTEEIIWPPWKRLYEMSTTPPNYTPASRVYQDRLYVLEIQHNITFTAEWEVDYMAVSPKGYRAGMFPRVEMIGEYIPDETDLFILNQGGITIDTPVRGTDLKEEMEKTGFYTAYYVKPKEKAEVIPQQEPSTEDKIKQIVTEEVKRILENPTTIENVKRFVGPIHAPYVDDIIKELNPYHLPMTGVYSLSEFPSEDIVIDTLLELCPAGFGCDTLIIAEQLTKKGYTEGAALASINEMISSGKLERSGATRVDIPRSYREQHLEKFQKEEAKEEPEEKEKSETDEYFYIEIMDVLTALDDVINDRRRGSISDADASFDILASSWNKLSDETKRNFKDKIDQLRREQSDILEDLISDRSEYQQFNEWFDQYLLWEQQQEKPTKEPVIKEAAPYTKEEVPSHIEVPPRVETEERMQREQEEKEKREQESPTYYPKPVLVSEEEYKYTGRPFREINEEVFRRISQEQEKNRQRDDDLTVWVRNQLESMHPEIFVDVKISNGMAYITAYVRPEYRDQFTEDSVTLVDRVGNTHRIKQDIGMLLDRIRVAPKREKREEEERERGEERFIQFINVIKEVGEDIGRGIGESMFGGIGGRRKKSQPPVWRDITPDIPSELKRKSLEEKRTFILTYGTPSEDVFDNYQWFKYCFKCDRLGKKVQLIKYDVCYACPECGTVYRQCLKENIKTSVVSRYFCVITD